jgi:hypothetical protein
MLYKGVNRNFGRKMETQKLKKQRQQKLESREEIELKTVRVYEDQHTKKKEKKGKKIYYKKNEAEGFEIILSIKPNQTTPKTNYREQLKENDQNPLINFSPTIFKNSKIQELISNNSSLHQPKHQT